MNSEETAVKAGGQHEGDESNRLAKPATLTVTVDGVEKRVPRGTYIVSVFKPLVGVDASRELDLVIRGEFVPLQDNASITIEHHEKFVSHVRTGCSS